MRQVDRGRRTAPNAEKNSDWPIRQAVYEVRRRFEERLKFREPVDDEDEFEMLQVGWQQGWRQVERAASGLDIEFRGILGARAKAVK